MLCLPRSFSTVTLYHPQVMDIPSLIELKAKTKLTLLCSISTSCDPMIQELSDIFMDHKLCINLSIPVVATELLTKAKSSLATITSKTLSNQCHKVLLDYRMRLYNTKLSQLLVQWQFLDVTRLEETNQAWKCITDSLPSGQLSFINWEQVRTHCQLLLTLSAGDSELILDVPSVVIRPPQYTTSSPTAPRLWSRADTPGGMIRLCPHS